MKTEIVTEALKNLKLTTQIEGELKESNGIGNEQMLSIKIGTESVNFNIATIKKELRAVSLPQIFSLKKLNNDIIVIAEKIFPKIKEQLKQAGIAYLDAAGNVFINKDKIYIYVENNKVNSISDKTANRAFSKTGLRLVFDFLQNENLLNERYRNLAQGYGIAVANINYVISNLKQLGYIVEIDKTHLKLVDKEKLLRRWINAYDEKLKPSVLLGKYRFLKEQDFNNWQSINLKGKTVWGGEPAGEQLTDNLKPTILTLYTEEVPSELIKNYRLIPDKNGNIEVYKRFWIYEEVKYGIAPPLLIYTDLINSGDARNIETAEKIFNDVIKNRL